MTSTMTTTVGTSNVRSTSRQTRTNPTRISKTVGSSLRQNSLLSNAPASMSGANEPQGFFPAITHFADAIAALPREFRRHTSLLKEVDAKAWAPEEELHNLLARCLAQRQTTVHNQAHTVTGPANTVPDDTAISSAANSVTGPPTDNASQYSAQSVDSGSLQRRQMFAAVRHNLIQLMQTMDEKNHVINNANEELARHIRRLDNVWPHIADEISEEARLGSVKHWAYTETNPSKKNAAPTTRREAAAASLAAMHDNDVAHRSESRREAMLAKKHGREQHIESDLEDPKATKKTTTGKKKVVAEVVAETAGLGISGVGPSKRKKSEKNLLIAAGMERSLSAAVGGRPMSREPSQQDNGKKRKAPAGASTVARKRLNVNPQDSPKLASSPLAGTLSKEIYKRSPALSAARPVQRARQNSNQTIDSARNRPSSSASNRNVNGVSAITTEIGNVVASNSKAVADSKNTMKEPGTKKAERIAEEDGVKNPPDPPSRSGLLLERSASKQSNLRREINATEDVKPGNVASPRTLPNIVTAEPRDRSARARGSKMSTPVVSTFSEAESADLTTNGYDNGKQSVVAKARRLARPKQKDHGLHDSLSPKGLPPKRSHKKGAGLHASVLGKDQRGKDQESEVSAPPSSADVAEIEEEEDESEEKFCYCDGPSFGEMVACDNEQCPREWFHLECIGLKKLPDADQQWLCDHCKEALAKKGKSNGNGNGRSR